MSNLSISVAEFDGTNIRITPDGRFSVYDVLVAFLPPTIRKGKVGKGINPRDIYKSITERYPEVVGFSEKFKFPGRGQRETPVADEEGMYQVLMLCPGKRGADFRQLAAKVLKERREEESNPELAYVRGRQRTIEGLRRQGKSEKDIALRIEAIETRCHFTDTLKDHGVNHHWQYAQITNAMYEELLGGTAKEIKKERNLPAKANVRDAMTRIELASVTLSELLATRDIERENLQGYKPCKDASEEAAKKVRKAID